MRTRRDKPTHLLASTLQVTAISSSPDKEAEAKKFGARHFVVEGSESEKALANTQELIINTISAPNDYAAQVQMLRPNGNSAVQ